MSTGMVWFWVAGPIWSLVGALVIPARYRQMRRDTRLTGVAGGLVGASLGPAGLGWLWLRSGPLDRVRHVIAPGILLIVELTALFASTFPESPCVTSASYVLNQLQTGLSVGLVYAMMAAGLTLIYSIQRIISFAHGQFVMLGGVVAYVLLGAINVNPVLAIPVVGFGALVGGIVVATLLLRPIQTGRVERPDEFSLLITFGLGLFLTYTLLSVLGAPTGIRSPSYSSMPILGIDQEVYVVGPLRLRTDLIFAGGVGLVIYSCLILLLYRTWFGRAARAVSMDREAAAVAGIDSGRIFVLAFGLGSALAAMAGAALVPVFAFQVPDMAGQTAIRSFVVVVLGGLGSVPGALVGGLGLGVAEAATAACYPDPAKGANYQIVAGLLLFLAVLLLRPRGLFGRAD